MVVGARRRTRPGCSTHLRGDLCVKLFDTSHVGGVGERIGRVVATISREAARGFDDDEGAKDSHLGKVTAQNPLASFLKLCPKGPRHDDRRGKWRDHPGKGQGELFASSTTEKMLSAISKMSNIFLQTGINIDIAHKNRVLRRINFGS